MTKFIVGLFTLLLAGATAIAYLVFRKKEAKQKDLIQIRGYWNRTTCAVYNFGTYLKFLFAAKQPEAGSEQVAA